MADEKLEKTEEISQKGILLVESSPEVAASITKILGEDYRVHAVSTALDAVMEFLDAESDLVLVNINLPGDEGLEAITDLRSNHGCRVLGYLPPHEEVSKKLKAEALKRGAISLVGKVLESKFLLSAVRSQLETELPTAIRHEEIAIELEQAEARKEEAEADPRPLVILLDSGNLDIGSISLLFREGGALDDCRFGIEQKCLNFLESKIENPGRKAERPSLLVIGSQSSANPLMKLMDVKEKITGWEKIPVLLLQNAGNPRELAAMGKRPAIRVADTTDRQIFLAEQLRKALYLKSNQQPILVYAKIDKTRRLITGTLIRYGFSFSRTESLEELEAKLQYYQFGLFVVECYEGDKAVVSLLRKIVAERRHAKTKILLLVASPTKKFIMEMVQLKVAGFLQQSFDPDSFSRQLLGKIRNYPEIVSTRKELMVHPHPSQKAHIRYRTFDSNVEIRGELLSLSFPRLRFTVSDVDLLTEMTIDMKLKRVMLLLGPYKLMVALVISQKSGMEVTAEIGDLDEEDAFKLCDFLYISLRD